MSLILWGVIVLVMVLLDRKIVSEERHNRKAYLRKKCRMTNV